jgi:hypothetical protein
MDILSFEIVTKNLFEGNEMRVFVLKLVTFLVIFCEVTFLVAEEKPLPPRLIVRGDDMGFSHSGNQGIMKCALEGIQTSIEVIVPSPWFPEAVKLLKEHPKLDVGIHIALSSEWDNHECSQFTRPRWIFLSHDFSEQKLPEAIFERE